MQKWLNIKFPKMIDSCMSRSVSFRITTETTASISIDSCLLPLFFFSYISFAPTKPGRMVLPALVVLRLLTTN